MIELLNSVNAADAWVACIAMILATVLTVYFTNKETK